MEQLNLINIIGKVGSVRISTVGDKKVANFSVATNCAYHDQDGTITVETTWHQVAAWSGDTIKDIDRIVKGQDVEVVGRLREIHYTGSDGTMRRSLEIRASSVRILDENTTIQMF